MSDLTLEQQLSMQIFIRDIDRANPDQLRELAKDLLKTLYAKDNAIKELARQEFIQKC